MITKNIEIFKETNTVAVHITHIEWYTARPIYRVVNLRFSDKSKLCKKEKKTLFYNPPVNNI